jgi:O-antigen ligase
MPDQLRIIRFVLGFTVLSSVIVQVFWPGAIPIVVDAAYDGQGWNGAFVHKNAFGRIIVLAALAFIMLSSGRLKPFRGALAICCAFALIGASQSRTALVVLVALLFLLAGSRWLLSAKHPGLIGLVGFVAGLPLLYLASANLEYLTGMLGRNSTLTGRVGLWHLAFASFLKRPLFGYGYVAFWNVVPESLDINHTLHWNVPHAHNGFLELALQLGLVGLSLYLTYYVVSLRRAMEYARNNIPAGGALWPFAYLAFAFLYSITESSPLASNSILWILFTSAACSVAFAPALYPVKPEAGVALRDKIGLETAHSY